MGFNTFPCNPYPISTDELNKGNNDELNTRVTALESEVSDLDEQKANQITIAPPFNPETTYEVGDLVYYNGLSYRCTNEHTGEWDADDFAGTTIANELSSLMSGLTNGLVFEPYDAQPPGDNPFNTGGSGYVIQIKYHGTLLGYLVIREKNYSSPSNYPNAIELYNASWEGIWSITRHE